MKRLLFVVLVAMVFSNNLYAKPGKSSGSKGSFGSKPATTQQKKADAPNQSAPSPSPAAAGSNAASAPAANAPANPSLMQSVMPALVGGAAGSYIGSKLADDGSSEKPVEGTEEKKEGQLKP